MRLDAAQVLEPEYYHLGVEYADTLVHDYYSSTMTVRLIGIVGTPTWQPVEISTFSDGTSASPVYSLSFLGTWEFTGKLTVYDESFNASTIETRYCSLQFALAEDAEGNVKWRIFSGTLTRASATPECSIYVAEEYPWGICIGAGFSSALDLPLNNNLEYDLLNVHLEGTDSASQTLTAFEYVSPYPCFILLADHITRFQYADTENPNYDRLRAVIVLESGSGDPEQETGVIAVDSDF